MKKNIVMSFIAAVAVLVAGCKHTPSEDTIRATAESVGRAAGFAVELSRTKTEVKDAILAVLDEAVKVAPKPGQSFAEAWRPIVDEEIGKLVAAGKLKEEDAALVKKILYVACDGVDLVFVKYPKAKEYANLVSAAVNGFAKGFKSVVSLAASPKAAYDEDAYKVLKAKFEAK